jgi:hypothetical protein
MEFAQLAPGRAFKPVNSLLYYLQRVVTSRRLRHALADGLARYIARRHGALPAAAPLHPASIDGLRRDGCVPLGPMLSDQQLAQIRFYLRDKPLFARGKSLPPFSLDEEPPAGLRMAEYALADVIGCPPLLELANHPGLLRLAEDYIGCKPTISAIGLRWSFPDAGTGTGLQGFHRDADDWRFIKVFAYLTDVDEDSGPHVYVRGTHLEHCGLRLRAYSDAEIMQAYGGERIESVNGKAGFAFAVNTHGIHKGMLPRRRPRLLLQIQYSLLPVYLYRYRPIASGHAGSLDPYINRLFLSRRAQ